MFISVMLFVQRCLSLLVTVLVIQFLYLNCIAEASLGDTLTLLGVGAISICFMLLIFSKIGEDTYWPRINSALFSMLYVLAFIAVIFFSRLEYIVSFLQHGLYATRENQELGRGGIYSVLTVMFYPLAIILTFVELKKGTRYVFLTMLAGVMVIDFIFLGTRNAPVFVILFHLLTIRRRMLAVRSLVIILFTAVAFVVLFDWQTQSRSLDTMTVGWEWQRTLRYSWLMEHLAISDSTLEGFSSTVEFLFPVVFLGQYLTHSISVLAELLSADVFELIGSAPYLQDQWCVLFKCDRSVTLEQILAINPSAGL